MMNNLYLETIFMLLLVAQMTELHKLLKAHTWFLMFMQEIWEIKKESIICNAWAISLCQSITYLADKKKTLSNVTASVC